MRETFRKMLFQSIVFCALVTQGFSLPVPTDQDSSEELSYFQCKDGMRVLINWLCDGEKDCPGGEDEDNCFNKDSSETNIFGETRLEDDKPSTINSGAGSSFMFICESGHKIPYWWRCDAVEDCPGGDDERDCPGGVSTEVPTTASPELESTTLPEQSGKPDPTNLEDKNTSTDVDENGNCVYIPPFSSYKMPGFFCDGRCFPGFIKCNGRQDCADLADENDCPYETTTNVITTEDASVEAAETTTEIEALERGGTEEPASVDEKNPRDCDYILPFLGKVPGFFCDGRCFAVDYVRCNGRQDCADGSDEDDCTYETTTNVITTEAEDFTIEATSENVLDSSEAGKTIPAEEHNSRHCEYVSLFSGLTREGFLCGGRCLPSYFKCDGDRDCDDGFDEEDCPVETTTNVITTEDASVEAAETTTESEALETGRTEETASVDKKNSRDCDYVLPFIGIVPGFFCDGRCYAVDYVRCNGRQDCWDGSDEDDCTYEATTTEDASVEVTTETEVETSRPEEPEPEDEKNSENCQAYLPLTDAYTEGFFCDERCVPNSFKCDRVNDCRDRSDESNCPAVLLLETTEKSLEPSENVKKTFEDENNLSPDSTIFPSLVELMAVGGKVNLTVNDFAPLLPAVTVNINVDHVNNYFVADKNKTEETTEVKEVEVKEKKKWFELYHAEANWMEANVICKSKGGELASINSRDENSAAWLKLILSEKPVYRAWIGGICPTKGEPCYWTDSWKQFDFSSWFDKEPNHLFYDNKDEMCVQFKLRDEYFWNWNDDHCSKELPFICQYFDE